MLLSAGARLICSTSRGKASGCLCDDHDDGDDDGAGNEDGEEDATNQMMQICVQW